MYGGFTAGTSAASKTRTPHTASSHPSVAAAVDRRKLSTRSCRTMRQRLAPRVVRIEISRERPTARARRRLATLAQAMRSTNATAPSRDLNTSFVSLPLKRSLKFWTMTPMSLFVVGYSSASRPAIALNSPRASAERRGAGQTSEQRQAASLAPLQLAGPDQRHPEVARARKGDAARHHADDDRGRVVDADRSPDHRGVLTVAALPQRVAQEDDRLGARLFIFSGRSRGPARASAR